MSGVCGILRYDGRVVTDLDLNRLMGALAGSGQGPDRRRLWRRDTAGLGAVLARVTREDTFDAQPLRDPDRDLTFVCDARIDNREEIAAALGFEPGSLASMADSAILFAAYKAWGELCPERLIGDFVFAAWDGAARSLTLARDHMGQRSVAFHAGNGFFAFATDRRALLALPEVPRRLPNDKIARLLIEGNLFHSGKDVSSGLGDGIGGVLGGTMVIVSADGVMSERRYWTPHPGPEHLGRDEAYYVEAYQRILGEAVACRVRRATAPAALMMGGGYDSGAIAALAGQTLGPAGGKLIAVASVSASGRPRDARRWVEACERHMPHLDVRYITQEDPNALAKLEQGFFISSGPHSENRFINSAIFAAAKAAGARVIMDGHGGDYTVNPRSHEYFIERLRRGRWRVFASEWQARRGRLGRSHWKMFTAEILPFAVPARRRWLRWRKGLPLFGSPMPVAAAFAAKARASGVQTRHPKRKSLRDGMMSMLLLIQRSTGSMLSVTAAEHGMEFTQPFHDKRVVELGLAIPDDYRLRDGRERHLARAALKDLYPFEFQIRDSGNDLRQPDFIDMVERLRPAILAEIDRMEQAGKLSAYFDFPKMRRMLRRRVPGRSGILSEPAARLAIRAFIWARYIEWFTGTNS